MFLFGILFFVMEILLASLYAVCLGTCNICKKLSIKKTSEATVLVLFATTAFLLSCIWIPFGVMVEGKYILILATKGLLVTFNWFVTLKVLKKVDLSIVNCTQIISVVITFLSGIIIFHETTSALHIVGSLLVVLGVFFMNFKVKDKDSKLTFIQLILLLVTTFFTSLTSIIDKSVLSTISTQASQFWFLLFVSLFSWIVFGVDSIRRKTFDIKKQDFGNYWIYIASITLFVGDIMLFNAFKVPGSQLITINILANLKHVISVIGGIIVFKERNVKRKILLTFVIVLGAILLSVA